MTSHVVLGLGGCVDYELKLSASTLEQLVDQYQVRQAELNRSTTVASERDLVISILGYIQRGGGGEHFVASTATLDAFAGRFPAKIAVGGTSVRTGIVMSRLGVPSTLHLVSVNSHVRALLPAACEYISSGTQDTLYPHLIVQYDQALRIRAGDIDIRAPFANRLIYVNDPANENLLLSEELGPLLQRADVFLISGLNAVRDKDLLDQRLGSLRCHMRQLPAEALVYFEDAAYHEPSFSQRVRDALVGLIGVYGLNEDEMQAHLGHPVDLLSVPDVERAFTELRKLIPVPTLVVHTKYWSAALGANAEGYGQGLEAGMAIASTRYAYGDDYTDEQYFQFKNRSKRPDAAAFAAALMARMGPVVQCRPGLEIEVAEPTTVGLGDTFVGGFLATVSKTALGQLPMGKDQPR